MTTTTATATATAYEIITYVDGVQEWPAETITAGRDYELGDELGALCDELAAIAADNTTWVTRPRSVVVVIPAPDSDSDSYSLASGQAELAHP